MPDREKTGAQLEREIAELRRQQAELLRILARFAGDAKVAVEERCHEAEYDSLFDLRASTLALLDESKAAA